MEYPYFPDHNVSPTIVIMKENIEEGGGVSGAKGRDVHKSTTFSNFVEPREKKAVV